MMGRSRIMRSVILLAGVVLVTSCRREPPEVPASGTVVDEPPRIPVIAEPVLPELPAHVLDPDAPKPRMAGVLPGPEFLPEPQSAFAPRDYQTAESFDPEEHLDAMMKLAPAHHARIAETRLAFEAVGAREKELLETPPFAGVRDEIVRLREAMDEAEGGAVRAALAGKLAQQEAQLQAMLEADASWQALRAEALSADRRRENARAEITARIQARMRHAAAARQSGMSETQDIADLDENLGQ